MNTFERMGTREKMHKNDEGNQNPVIDSQIGYSNDKSAELTLSSNTFRGQQDP